MCPLMNHAIDRLLALAIKSRFSRDKNHPFMPQEVYAYCTNIKQYCNIQYISFIFNS